MKLLILKFLNDLYSKRLAGLSKLFIKMNVKYSVELDKIVSAIDSLEKKSNEVINTSKRNNEIIAKLKEI